MASADPLSTEWCVMTTSCVSPGAACSSLHCVSSSSIDCLCLPGSLSLRCLPCCNIVKTCELNVITINWFFVQFLNIGGLEKEMIVWPTVSQYINLEKKENEEKLKPCSHFNKEVSYFIYNLKTFFGLINKIDTYC